MAFCVALAPATGLGTVGRRHACTPPQVRGARRRTRPRACAAKPDDPQPDVPPTRSWIQAFPFAKWLANLIAKLRGETVKDTPALPPGDSVKPEHTGAGDGRSAKAPADVASGKRDDKPPKVEAATAGDSPTDGPADGPADGAVKKAVKPQTGERPNVLATARAKERAGGPAKEPIEKLSAEPAGKRTTEPSTKQPREDEAAAKPKPRTFPFTDREQPRADEAAAKPKPPTFPFTDRSDEALARWRTDSAVDARNKALSQSFPATLPYEPPVGKVGEPSAEAPVDLHKEESVVEASSGRDGDLAAPSQTYPFSDTSADVLARWRTDSAVDARIRALSGDFPASLPYEASPKGGEQAAEAPTDVHKEGSLAEPSPEGGLSDTPPDVLAVWRTDSAVDARIKALSGDFPASLPYEPPQKAGEQTAETPVDAHAETSVAKPAETSASPPSNVSVGGLKNVTAESAPVELGELGDALKDVLRDAGDALASAPDGAPVDPRTATSKGVETTGAASGDSLGTVDAALREWTLARDARGAPESATAHKAVLPTTSILFLGTDNSTVSVAAEAIFSDLVKRRRPSSVSIVCRSAGTAVAKDGVAPDALFTEALMFKRGLDVSSRGTSKITASDLNSYDLVVCMDSTTRNQALYMVSGVEKMTPEVEARFVVISSYCSQERLRRAQFREGAYSREALNFLLCGLIDACHGLLVSLVEPPDAGSR